jgi:hypothetical protein
MPPLFSKIFTLGEWFQPGTEKFGFSLLLQEIFRGSCAPGI